MDLVELNLGNAHRHPWEYSRADCMLKILKGFPVDAQYADVGAGDVYFATRLAAQLTKPIYVVDTGYEQVGPKGKLIAYNNINQLQDESIDVLLLMDVLEHIEDVDAFFDELMTKVKPGGRILITVPAFPFVFSNHDVALRHFRRYTLKSLKLTLQKHQLEVEKAFYFYSLLLLARMMLIPLEKLGMLDNTKGAGGWKHGANSPITKFIHWLLNADFNVNYFLSNFGIRTIGLSICTTCKKKS